MNVPDGWWKVVPLDLTKEMRLAFHKLPSRAAENPDAMNCATSRIGWRYRSHQRKGEAK